MERCVTHAALMRIGRKEINCLKSNGKEAHDLKVVVVVTEVVACRVTWVASRS
jgi:hypothetical protein